MKKELLKFLCTSLFALGCMSVNGQETSGSCGENATWEFNGGILTISGTGTITTYSTTQPTEYPWFGLMNDICVVQIGEGITNVPDWAFAMYGNLSSISLPSTIKTIGNSALEECAFSKIYLPEGLETIGHYAFSDNPLVAVCLPSTVTFIGQAAFSYCEDLLSVGCYASTPPTLYDNTVFDDSPNIETVYVQTAKVQAYKDDENWGIFGDNIKSPNGECGTNATWAFEMATRALTISGTGDVTDHSGWDSAELMGQGGGFNPDKEGYPCGIKRVVIGEGITTIPDYCFNMEAGITSITLPSTLTNIGEQCFGECFNLATITCNATTPPTLGDYALDQCDELIAIYVPGGTEGAYQTAPGWDAYSALIQMSNTKVGNEYWTTFYDATTNYEVDENTSIMIIWGIEDGKIKTAYTNLSPESDNIIPAGQAVILRSTGIPVLTATPTESTNDAFNDNLLLGSEADKGDFENYNYYALANAGAGLGFYKVGNGTTIPVGKAYLKIDKAASSNFYSIDPDDNTTAIKNMKVGKNDNVYYDLSGRRVLYPKKGLYIMNGKKVIIK